MSKQIKLIAALAIGVFILAGKYSSYMIVSATKNDTFSRPTYSLQEMYEGALGDKITFNSIVLQDSDYEWYKSTHDGKSIPQGTLRNETSFVGARVAGTNQGAANVWEGNEITVTDGDIIYVRLFVHNANPGGLNAVAEDTKVRFYIPYDISNTITVNGRLTSSNAVPSEYVDDVTFKSPSGEAFHLQYIYGSALLENGGGASGEGTILSDSITNQGNMTENADNEWTLIGYDSLDGRIPGGYKYVNYITIMVRVVFDYDYTVETKVRLVGDEDGEWKDTIEAKLGDKVEFQIEYKNTSDKTQMDVSMQDILPSNLNYISGSAKLYNANYPSGVPFTHDNLVNQGVNINGYTAGSNAIIYFQVEVVDDNLACGSNTMVNWGRAGVGTKTIQDYARVVVKKDMHIFITEVVVLSMLILICLVAIIVLFYKMYKNKQNHT